MTQRASSRITSLLPILCAVALAGSFLPAGPRAATVCSSSASTCEPGDCDTWEALFSGPVIRPDNALTEQVCYDRAVGEQGNLGLGQIFVPTTGDLHRIDLLMKNRGDLRPITIRLWTWERNSDPQDDDADYQDTVAKKPLWEDRIVLPGVDDWLTVSLFPRLAVTVGAEYYIEFDTEPTAGEWGIAIADSLTDHYAAGRLRINGVFRPCVFPSPAFCTGAGAPFMDLWFRIYDSSVGTATADTSLSDAPTWTDADTDWVCMTGAPAPRPLVADDLYQILREKAVDGVRNGFPVEQMAFHDAFVATVDPGETCTMPPGIPSGDANPPVVLDCAEAAKQILLEVYAQAVGGSPPNTGFVRWLERVGWAYLWLVDLGTLSDVTCGQDDTRDECKIKALVADAVEEQLPDRVHGVSFGLTYTLSFELATRIIGSGQELADLTHDGVGNPHGALFSGPLGATEYTTMVDWIDDRWGEFHCTGAESCHEIWENASHYQVLLLRTILQLVELREENDIWSEPGFRALIDRIYQFHHSLGPNAVFGDTRGTMRDWATTIWLFSRAAIELGNPDYERLAYRIFDYQCRHVNDPIPLFRRMNAEWVSLAHAYRAIGAGTIDDPAEPTRGEVLDANQPIDSAAIGGNQNAPVGQVFRPTNGTLARLDVELGRTGGGAATATVRIWEWDPAASYTVNTGADPLFVEQVDLPTGSTPFSFYPMLSTAATPSQTGQTSFFFEISASKKFDVTGVDSDAYLDGSVWVAGVEESAADLWFESYGLTENHSRIVERPLVRQLRYSELGDPPKRFEFAPGPILVPEKLVLRSGHGVDDMSAVFDLVVNPYHHAHREVGALVGLAANGAQLLNSGTYVERQPKDTNTVIARRFWGDGVAGACDNTVESVDIDSFLDARGVTLANLAWDDPAGCAIERERRIVFVKNRFVVVRDRVGLNAAMEVGLMQLWHGRNVRNPTGTPTTLVDLYSATPEALIGTYKNPEQYARLFVTDRGYGGLGTHLESGYAGGNPDLPPYLVFQRWYGDVSSPPDDRWFDAILIPRDEPNGTDTLTVVPLDVAGDTMAVRLDLSPTERWYVVDNPDGVEIDVPEITTDGRTVIARLDEAGNVLYLMTQGASEVRVGNLHETWPGRTSVETP